MNQRHREPSARGSQLNQRGDMIIHRLRMLFTPEAERVIIASQAQLLASPALRENIRIEVPKRSAAASQISANFAATVRTSKSRLTVFGVEGILQARFDFDRIATFALPIVFERRILKSSRNIQ
jgi:hypothetical protein